MHLRFPRERAERVRIGIVVVKFVVGAAELFAGIALLFLSPGQLRDLVVRLTREEHQEDPNDVVVSFVRSHLGDLVTTRHALAAGILVLGAIKVVGAYGLLKRRPWGYFVLVAVVVLLLPYNAYRTATHPTIGTVAIAVINLVILGLLIGFRKHLLGHPGTD